MKLTTSRLLVILIILIGALAIVRWTRNTGRSKSFRTELVNFDADQADRVEIISPDAKTVLTRSDKEWQVDTDEGPRPAMEGNVKSLLNTLNTIQPSRLAARDESKWKDFSVDSTGSRVIVYDGDQVLSDIILGRFGVEGQRSFYTYVRLADDEDVYVAEDFMKMSISTRPEDFRNNVLGRIGGDSLTQITFDYPDSALVLIKEKAQWLKDDTQADSAAVAGYVKTLSFISSRKFAAGSPGDTAALNVTYQFQNGATIKISAWKDGDDWILTSSANPGEAWKDPANFKKIFVPVSQF